ncbi:MAG: hypothetical protein QOE03_3992 [Micromonosporaceae bacterium]|nr:hypothetical protein [Micromonosporaceae bacterium]
MTQPGGTARTLPFPAAGRAQVLLVDDDTRILAALRRQLHRRYEIFTAESGSQGLAVLAAQPSIAVVISDMRMPGMDGATFLAQVRAASPRTTRVLLTGQTDLDAAIRAINDGQIFRFLNKPCPPDALDKCLQDAVVRHEAACDEYRLLSSVVGDRRVLDDSHSMYEALAVGLQAGLNNHEFRLQYQPIVNLADGSVMAVEALVRWTHPGGELVQAVNFLPAAETSGLIMPLGRWVMAAACQEIASWPAMAATETLRVNINVSDAQLRDPGLVDDFANTLILSGLEAGRLTLEVDESPALREVLPIRSLTTMAAWGIHLALAAFTDETILRALAEILPFEAVKVGKHLSGLLPGDQQAALICRSIVGTARNLAIQTIVEGIETVEQQDACRALGFDFAQGYLFGRPTEPGELLGNLLGPGSEPPGRPAGTR